MARWVFIAADVDGDPRGELTAARDRKLTIALDGPSEAAFAINGRHDQALLVNELTSDLVVYRDQTKLYRGRIGKTHDEGDAAAHTVEVESADYRALLGRREIRSDGTLVFDDVDQEAVGWQLIADTQARTGGDLRITRGADQDTGVLRDRTYAPGKNLAEALEQLGNVANGFDWSIDPELVYRVWYPTRGSDVDGERVVLDFGGSVIRFSRTVDPGQFTNAPRVTGDEALAAEERESADLATAVEGRFEASFGYGDVIQQATLAARADWHLAEGETLRPSWTVVLRNGAWQGPDHLWVGDTGLLVVRSGRLDVVTHARVHEISIRVDNSDNETVTAVLDRPLSTARRRNRLIEQRLVNLERR